LSQVTSPIQTAPLQTSRTVAPSWGTFRHRTIPAVGNHEYKDGSGVAKAYFDFFNGSADSGLAGHRARGWYRKDVGNWTVLVINSERQVPAQVTWIRETLVGERNRCQVAIYHRPYFTSGPLLPHKPTQKPLIQALYDMGVEVVIGGHNHHNERLAPMNPSGTLDALGPRQLVAGGGGHRSLDNFTNLNPNSVWRSKAHGVLRLHLRSSSYSWEFLSLSGTAMDAGSAPCYGTFEEPVDTTPPDTTTPPPQITLTVSGSRLEAYYSNELRWSGAGGDSVDVWKDGRFKKRELNDGKYVNRQLYLGPATYTYKVCEKGSTVCSNDASVTYE
jgi:acid phosphatase type 7